MESFMSKVFKLPKVIQSLGITDLSMQSNSSVCAH